MSGALVNPDALGAFCHAVLLASGADAQSADDITRALMHASVHGVDSHGVRLLPLYDRELRGGRVNGTPTLAFQRTRAGTGLLDADDGHGARACYAAVAHAADLAKEAGIGAVAVRRTSHFGAAGAYATALAQRGLIGLVTCNSDAFVRLHDGAQRFHGTNPIAFAVPTASDPWLLDMATSSVPYNKIQLAGALGQTLPDAVASDSQGRDTTDPALAYMLAPLGGAFGYKGAALAGMADILSAILTGMRLSHEIAPFPGPDFETPRQMGAFVLALNPADFAGEAAVAAGMDRYLAALRGSPSRPHTTVMAPGDREWAEARRRRANGIPIDPETHAAFAALAETAGLALPQRHQQHRMGGHRP